MALGRGVSSGKGGVQIVLQPPAEFILRQNGAFRRKLEDLDELWDRFEPLMSELEQQMWETEEFGEWPPLAASTLAQKSRYGFPFDTLVRTGVLRDSLTDPSAAATRSGQSFEWGTDVDYARYHQEGVSPGPPQREVIPDPFPTEWRRLFEREMVNYVNDAARRTWGLV